MELFDENYYAKAVANIIGEVKDPIMYKWFYPIKLKMLICKWATKEL